MSSRSSGSSSASNHNFSDSPWQILSMTSGPNSLGDGSKLKSPGLSAHVVTVLLSPSAARTSFDTDALRKHRDSCNGRTCARDGDNDNNIKSAARPWIVITTDGPAFGHNRHPLHTPVATQHALYRAQDDDQTIIRRRSWHLR